MIVRRYKSTSQKTFFYTTRRAKAQDKQKLNKDNPRVRITSLIPIKKTLPATAAYPDKKYFYPSTPFRARPIGWHKYSLS